MDDDAILSALGRATTGMSAAIAGLDPATPVPTCPGWDLTALVDHLGRVHRWAEVAVRTGEAPDPYPRRDREQELRHWYADSAELLLATLSAREPDEPAWSFSAEPGHGQVRFWRRRQLHETTIHRIDALAAAGGVDLSGEVDAVSGLSAVEAADGVEEVFEVFAPRALVRRPDESPEVVVPAVRPVALACTDVDAAWTLQLVDGVPVVRPGVAQGAAAVVSGPATHLYLALWHRADGRALAVEGDDSLARRLLDASLVP